MTRFLSESLQAPEPYFRLGLKGLESSNGNPNHDIRLTTDIIHLTKKKLNQLGLDPNDTKPAELYRALQEKLTEDDKRLVKLLRTKAATHVSADGDLLAGMTHVLSEMSSNQKCYALKSSVLRSLLKKVQPKKTLKKLGYRSFDSMLKHESPVIVTAAAWLSESESWRHKLLEQYKHLKPSDFEIRNVQVLKPDTKKWQEIAERAVDQHRRNVLCFKELGSLILLPLPKELPSGVTTASFGLALHELNEIRASSSFLKMSQVRADFGNMVKIVASDEPKLKSQILDQQVPWDLIQRYYGRLGDKANIFEPHLDQTDMIWQSIEQKLASLDSSFKFWLNTSHLGVLDDHKPVSFNLLDTAINLCNELPFEQRISHYFQKSLWNELVLRYLRHQPVEEAVLSELQPQLAPEYSLTEVG